MLPGPPSRQHQEVLVGAPVAIRQRLRVGLHLKQPPGNLAPLGMVSRDNSARISTLLFIVEAYARSTGTARAGLKQ